MMIVQSGVIPVGQYNIPAEVSYGIKQVLSELLKFELKVFLPSRPPLIISKFQADGKLACSRAHLSPRAAHCRSHAPYSTRRWHLRVLLLGGHQRSDVLEHCSELLQTGLQFRLGDVLVRLHFLSSQIAFSCLIAPHWRLGSAPLSSWPLVALLPTNKVSFQNSKWISAELAWRPPPPASTPSARSPWCASLFYAGPTPTSPPWLSWAPVVFWCALSSPG